MNDDMTHDRFNEDLYSPHLHESLDGRRLARGTTPSQCSVPYYVGQMLDLTEVTGAISFFIIETE